MKKSEKQAVLREIEYLKKNNLTAEELRVIRKLNGASSVEGHDGYSRRTVEAVLQGRRSNVMMLHDAIRNAKTRLEEYTAVMDRLLKKLRQD